MTRRPDCLYLSRCFLRSAAAASAACGTIAALMCKSRDLAGLGGVASFRGTGPEPELTPLYLCRSHQVGAAGPVEAGQDGGESQVSTSSFGPSNTVQTRTF